MENLKLMDFGRDAFRHQPPHPRVPAVDPPLRESYAFHAAIHLLPVVDSLGRSSPMGQDVILLHVRVSTQTRRSSPARCQTCNAVLDLHQPVSARPGEILGTCPDCGGWHFLGLDDNGQPRLLAHLPLAELESSASGPL